MREFSTVTVGRVIALGRMARRKAGLVPKNAPKLRRRGLQVGHNEPMESEKKCGVFGKNNNSWGHIKDHPK